MTEQEFEEIVGLIHTQWADVRGIPDPTIPRPSPRAPARMKVWLGRLSPYPAELVERVIRRLSVTDDKFPSWRRLREAMGEPPRAEAERIHCNICHGEGVADVIHPRRGGAFPETVYAAVAPCSCTGAGPAHFREEIRERFDRARNLGQTYHIRFELDIDAARKRRKQKEQGAPT